MATLQQFGLNDTETGSVPPPTTLPQLSGDISRSTQPLAPTTIGSIQPPSRTTQPLPPVTPTTAPTSPTRTTQPLPGLPSQYALSLLKQGKTPQQVVDETNAAYNLQTGQQAVYYGNNNTIGLADGYYLAGPTFGNGMADWSPIARGNESAGGGASSPDLTALLTSLMSRFSAQPTNTIAALPAPVAPQVASASPSNSLMNPATGLPYGVSINPVNGTLINSPTGAAPMPLGSSTPGTGPSLTTQSASTGTGTVPGPVTTPSSGPTYAPYTPYNTIDGQDVNGGVGFDPNVPPTSPGAIQGAAAAMTQPTPGTAGASAPGSTSSNPFSDPTQMALWEAVQAAMSQSQQQPGQNPQTAALYAAINQIAQQLQGPAFTDQQLNNIRTASMDSIQRDQDAAVQAEIQRQGLLGQSPTSGTVTDAVNKIQNSYTTLRGQAQQANNIYELNTVDQRRQELLQALNLGAQTATGNTQLGFNNAVQGAELSTLPVTAENNALANALSVTNASNPMGLIQSILATIGQNNQTGQINAQNNAAFWQQLATQLAPFL